MFLSPSCAQSRCDFRLHGVSHDAASPMPWASNFYMVEICWIFPRRLAKIYAYPYWFSTEPKHPNPGSIRLTKNLFNPLNLCEPKKKLWGEVDEAWAQKKGQSHDFPISLNTQLSIKQLFWTMFKKICSRGVIPLMGQIYALFVFCLQSNPRLLCSFLTVP